MTAPNARLIRVPLPRPVTVRRGDELRVVILLGEAVVLDRMARPNTGAAGALVSAVELHGVTLERPL